MHEVAGLKITRKVGLYDATDGASPRDVERHSKQLEWIYLLDILLANAHGLNVSRRDRLATPTLNAK